MNRNQKIALGCGGAGCLGLIVVAVAGGLIYYFMSSSPSYNRNYNYNVSTNRNDNSNDNSDFTTNRNDNDNDNSSDSSSSSASSMSDEDQHRLYHAAGMTGDTELINRVSVKLGLMDDDFTPGAKYQQFVTDHVDWVIRNADFINSVNTAEKARAYVNTHIPD